ncbi:hypothetical protein M5K25_027736 [Dendrobium thyrsiflorum]|uniref:Reverse transcriptase zinc-binding domain-containing protein n=1 Tax=Dendrobium thyrsiflorum TaxID=117978 RepID=A0ABD0TUJ0_DENTH
MKRFAASIVGGGGWCRGIEQGNDRDGGFTKDFHQDFGDSNGAGAAVRVEFTYVEESVVVMKWLSNLKLKPKIHCFWWRLTKDAIPTNEYLNHRKLSESTSCARGCDEIENISHISMRCKFLIEIIMKNREWGFNVPNFQSTEEGIKELRRLSYKNPSVVCLYITVVFFSWKNRNAFKHGVDVSSVIVTATNILATTMHPRVNPILEDWDVSLRSEFVNL